MPKFDQESTQKIAEPMAKLSYKELAKLARDNHMPIVIPHPKFNSAGDYRNIFQVIHFAETRHSKQMLLSTFTIDIDGDVNILKPQTLSRKGDITESEDFLYLLKEDKLQDILKDPATNRLTESGKRTSHHQDEARYKLKDQVKQHKHKHHKHRDAVDPITPISRSGIRGK